MPDSTNQQKLRLSPLFILISFLLLTACSTISPDELNHQYGEADFTRYEAPVTAVHDTNIDYFGDVKPILEKRCVVCHGCYDSPCQLNLGSYEGLTRGASKAKVYNAARLRAVDPSRLFVDASSVSQWRGKGFYPVLNERKPDFNGDAAASVIHRLLDLKAGTDAAEENQPLDNSEFDFSLSRSQICPMVEEISSFEEDHSQWGMPYGFPKLEDDEYQVLSQWIKAGVPYKYSETLDEENITHIEHWEKFLNQDSLKAQLMSRYIYEHWFVAHLYFDDVKDRKFFQIVRSSTESGEAIKIIVTRRPYDDPGLEPFYYRLQEVKDSLLVKTHMPYVLSDSKMENYQKWFLDEEYIVDNFPGYEPKVASNPFIAFQDIPSDSRYRFMLDEARFTIMGYIKGPVCRGQIALNVINDYFWVVFADPAKVEANEDTEHLNEALKNIRFPAETGSTSGILKWRSYAKPQLAYFKDKAKYVDANYSGDNLLDMTFIWNGDDVNRNAALTVFRHFDTASVEYGLIGEQPQTVWVIEYPLLEKIHYLLVAGFDVYGNYGHQLSTRLYMDFLRMEGEFNFLALLPEEARNSLLNHWYRGSKGDTEKYFDDVTENYHGKTGITFTTDNLYLELQNKLKVRLDDILDDTFDIETLDLPAQTLQSLKSLSSITGLALQQMPPLAMIRIEGNDGKSHHLTLMHNNAHTNVAHLLSEDKRRLPEEDTQTLVKGFIGAYPNTYFKVAEDDLNEFVEGIQSLSTNEDYNRLLNQFAIRRTHPDFWQYSDQTMEAFKEWNPVEYGLLDYNRFENR